jgi:hypothetical protein
VCISLYNIDHIVQVSEPFLENICYIYIFCYRFRLAITLHMFRVKIFTIIYYSTVYCKSIYAIVIKGYVYYIQSKSAMALSV